MRGVILAAGLGVRLRPITETRPKPLIPVLDKPLIYFPMLLLRKLGVCEVIVVVGYMKEKIVDVVNRIANEMDMDVEVVEQDKRLGTAHALRVVVERGIDDDLVVVYGDIYLDPDIDIVIPKQCDLAIAGTYVDDVSRYGALVIDGDRVLEIAEKSGVNRPGYVNAGIYYLRKNMARLVLDIGVSPRGEYELTDIVKLANLRGYTVKLIEIPKGRWMDVGMPWSIIEVNKLALSRFSSRVIKGSVDSVATIKGPVYIDEGAEIRGATYIEGPAYIGRNTVVGPNSYIRPYSVILDNCRIGFSVEVKESVVFENTHAAHLSYIGDSVVCENVNLGAGTILANLRFDERTVKVTIEGKRVDSGRKKLGAFIGANVKTGVNVSIMPGVKIGSNAIIYPGVVVYRDVPSGAVVKSNWL